ncbi:MAG: AI-2E family transporter [Proteobacteria bacterium]|nr:AI-2E family transporter [Pseudomonadota bacterium]
MKKDRAPGRIKHIGLMAFAVLAAALLLYFLLFRSETVGSGIAKFFAVMRPIIYGFVIAYILNPPMHVIENFILKIYAKSKHTPGKRALSVIRLSSAIAAVMMLMLIVYALFALLLPELITSIRSIIANVPTYMSNIQKWYNSLVQNYALNESTKDIFSSVLSTAQDWVSGQFSPRFNGVISKVTNSLVDILVFFKNVLLGLIVSIYVMVSQDSILARSRRMIYALFNVATSNQIIKNLRFVDEKFGGFLIGKIIDSAIIGIICYIGAKIMGLPYALLISVVVGVTNIIPFFGPFIGAIPSAILICCVSPIQSLYFVIFILVLQQFDGNLLGPKILGNSVGVSSFMVLVAILIGGGFFGFMGMIIGVPLCAILTSIIQTLVLQRIANKDLPGDIESYHNMEKIDPWKREIIKLQTISENPSLYSKISQRSEDIAGFTQKLEDNPWDKTAEAVERERVLYQTEYQADLTYCTQFANQRDSYNVQYSDFPEWIREHLTPSSSNGTAQKAISIVPEINQDQSAPDLIETEHANIENISTPTENAPTPLMHTETSEGSKTSD